MYHYKECGLPNVWLENGYKVKQTPYGEAVSVVDADGLLKMLAEKVACKTGRLTGRELWFIRSVLCLSQKNMARLLGTTEQSLSLWERQGRMPKASEAIARMLALEHLGGNPTIAELIERINTVERMVNQRLVAKERRNAWTSKITTDQIEDAVAA